MVYRRKGRPDRTVELVQEEGLLEQAELYGDSFRWLRVTGKVAVYGGIEFLSMSGIQTSVSLVTGKPA